MFYKALILCGLCWAILFSAQAQIQHKHIHKDHVHTVTCKVFDAKTKQVLPQATVQLLNQKTGTVTNNDGHSELHFHQNCECTCRLKVSFVGYKSFITEFPIFQDTTFSIYLEEDSELLGSVEIADKGNLSEINSLTISKVDVAKMDAHKGESITNSLEEIAGVNSLRSGSAHIAKPVIHGLYGNRILVQYNGVRMEGQQWGNEHAPELDAFLAEELAVVKGAGSVRYGSDAMGGVVLVNPAKLPVSGGLGGKINLVGASNGRTLSGAIMLEGGLGNSEKWKGWGWRAQTSAKHGGDLHAPNYQLTNTGVRELNYSFSIGKQAENWGFETFYSHFNTDLGVLKATGSIGSLDDLKSAFGSETPQGTEDFSDEISNPRQEATHNLLKAKVFFERDFGTLSFQYALQNNKRKEFDVRRGALNEIPSMNLEIQTQTFDMDLTHEIGKNWSGNIGGSIMYQQNRNISGTQRSNFIPNFTSPSVGFYLIERWKENSLQLEGGLRYDFRNYSIKGWHRVLDFYEDEFSMQSLTASFGAIYQIDEKNTISTNIGTAWRPPHVSELYSFGKHQSNGSNEYGLLWNRTNSTQLGKYGESGVENEQSLKWVGTYNFASEKTFVELTAYSNWIKNYIYLRPEGIDFNSRTGILPLFGYTQGNALFQGIDIQLQQKLNANFTWQAQGSYLRAINTDNKESELPLIPANRIATSLRYETAQIGKFKSLFGSVTLSHNFQQSNAPRVISIEELEGLRSQELQPFELDNRNFDFIGAPESYSLVDLETGFSTNFNESELKFRVGVRNLLNTTYRSYTNRLRYFADDLGRNFTMSLQYIF
jgi:iron complex outermembrane receptor protein